ncbi:MAG: hypothetical protein ABI291_10025 [Acidobacteriaceae bacterium]
MFPAPLRHDPRRLLMNHRAGASLTAAKFRIGIAVDTPNGPAWIRELVDFLMQVPQFEISLCPQKDAVPAAEPRASWLAAQLIERSRHQFDPFAPGPASPLALAHGKEKFDLILCLTPGTPALGARYGSLSLQLGDRNIHPPYWGEVIARDPVSRVTLRWQENTLTPASVVRTAEVPTRRQLGFTWNADRCLLAAAQMFADVALNIFHEGPEWLTRARAFPEASELPERRSPNNLQCAAFAAREIYRSRTEPKPRPKGWFCALRRDPSRFYQRLGHFDGAGFEEIPMPPGAQMADPFLVEDNGRTWLFFEEVPPGTRKGRICCVEVPKPGQPFSKPEVVLELDTHLSYPCVFRHEGDYFMIPESCATQDLRLYRTTRFPFEWQLESLLMEDLPLTDTTPFFYDNQWYFFSTTMPPVQHTVLLTSAKLGGPLRLHPDSPVSCSWQNTRAAGHLFTMGDRLIRPTQDCVAGYGYGIQMNEVTRLGPTEYAERAVDYIGPTWQRGLLGTHTLCSLGDVEVIDGRRYFPETK